MRTIHDRKVLLAVLVIAAVSLGIPGCDDTFDLVEPFDGPREVTMINHQSNSLPIHMLGPQEDFIPSNRVEPGESRNTVVRNDLRNRRGEVEFRAGRNGRVLETQVCMSRAGQGGAFVQWIDGRLDCGGDLENI